MGDIDAKGHAVSEENSWRFSVSSVSFVLFGFVNEQVDSFLN